MRLGFLALRKGFLKVTGAMIQAALDRGHEVVLLWDAAEAKPGEQVSPSDLAVWPAARVVPWSRHSPLTPVLRAHDVHALVSASLASSLRAFCRENEGTALREAGIRLYSVDYALDTITSEAAAYRVIDVTCYATAWQREQHWQLRAADFAAIGDRASLSARSAVVGSTMLDQLAVVDRAAARKRYQLPEDRPVVLLLSIKMAVPDPWRRLVWGEGPRWLRAARAAATGHGDWIPDILRSHGYRDLVVALRRLCDRHGAVLVVKSRRKNRDPRFLERMADAFVYDETVYPYTSMELMAIADLCVHFQSGGVLEAAFAGIPSLSIAVSREHLRAYPTYDLFDDRPDGLQNFPGVVWSGTPAEAIAKLDRASLSDFRVDPEARRAYIEKFVGFDDTRSSARALDVIEAAGR